MKIKASIFFSPFVSFRFSLVLPSLKFFSLFTRVEFSPFFCLFFAKVACFKHFWAKGSDDLENVMKAFLALFYTFAASFWKLQFSKKNHFIWKWPCMTWVYSDPKVSVKCLKKTRLGLLRGTGGGANNVRVINHNSKLVSANLLDSRV